MSDTEVEGGTSPPSAPPPIKSDGAKVPPAISVVPSGPDEAQIPPALNPPPRFRIKRTIPKPTFTDNAAAALFWAQYGFRTLPFVPGEKRPADKWAPWIGGATPDAIAAHWAEHPEHDVGCILGDSYIVLDADSPEAEQAIMAIEERFDIRARLVIRTKRGSHRYYQLAADVFAKSDSHSTAQYPERIDVKTGKACVTLPPSGGREIVVMEAAAASELSIVDQDFVDAVFVHNGRPVPRPSGPRPTAPAGLGGDLQKLEGLLGTISADCGYEDWLHVLMAIFHESGGSEEGLALADRWSSKGAAYKGTKDVEAKWRSFRPDAAMPVTIGTLVKMARDAGADVHAIMHGGDDNFEPCDESTADQGCTAGGASKATPNPLDQFSLRDHVEHLSKQMVDQVHFLGEIALLGQAIVIYAKPNTGKTLIVLYLLIDAIKRGVIDPARLYFINMDDDSRGLLDKGVLAEEYGFHMLADGHRDFEASAFVAAMRDMIERDTARGVIVVLDTLKKFVNTMDKSRASSFAKIVRRFVMKGGTVVALSHANKNPGQDGKVVYSGTTDIVDDFDCAYVLSTVSADPDTAQKVVEFTNIKRRGAVALSAAYSYALERDIAYNELLLSVSALDSEQLVPIKVAAEAVADAVVVEAVEACIRSGINSKMKLADAAAERAKVSRRAALQVIEKYTGEDPAQHRWKFDVRERGAKVFMLLSAAEPGTS
jgi:hypothetical protein